MPEISKKRKHPKAVKTKDEDDDDSGKVGLSKLVGDDDDGLSALPDEGLEDSDVSDSSSDEEEDETDEEVADDDELEWESEQSNEDQVDDESSDGSDDSDNEPTSSKEEIAQSDISKKGKSKNSLPEPQTSSAEVQPEPVDEYADGDSSDEEDIRNTIGNIPINWYDDFDHLGYDWDGKKILKPVQGDSLDEFLKKIEDPDFWRKVKDPQVCQKHLQHYNWK